MNKTKINSIFLLAICFASCKNTDENSSKKKFKISPKSQPGVTIAQKHNTEKPAVTDTIFHNVQIITDHDLVHKPDTIILTKKIAGNTPVIFMDSQVPTKFLPWIYPEYQRILVLIPNWKFYNDVMQSTPPGVCVEPMRSTIVYEFIRNNGKAVKDSVVHFGDNPIFE